MSDAQSAALATRSAGQQLAELPEPQASGELGRIYGEIRRLSAVPMVALIYRHLATIPGALEWAWGLIEPAMQAGLLQQRAWRLGADALIPAQRAIPRAALRAAGIGADDETAITAVLDAYNRANPVNIMAVHCLALHLAGSVKGPASAWPLTAWQPPAPLASLPSMVDPGAMDATVRELVILLANRSEAATPAPLWPSLYRHLAHWPALLGYASVVVVPEFAAIDAVAMRLREQVGQAAAELAPHMAVPENLAPPEQAQRERLQQAIDQFSLRIPEMVVIGGLLRHAMPPGIGPAKRRGVN